MTAAEFSNVGGEPQIIEGYVAKKGMSAACFYYLTSTKYLSFKSDELIPQVCPIFRSVLLYIPCRLSKASRF